MPPIEQEPRFITRPTLRIDQPLGTFFAFSLDARTLNDVCFSFPASVRVTLESEETDVGGYGIFRSQRREQLKRLDEIRRFIQSSEAVFPNSIVLAANYDAEGQLIEDESRRWTVASEKGRDVIKIPCGGPPSASIIDGQHRLHGFRSIEGNAHADMPLLCVAFIDLPAPYQAYIFATINFNQKKVDRSLAYELFGFDIEENKPLFWPPETLAVYTARVLNTDAESPLHGCIIPGAILPLDTDTPTFIKDDPIILVSMATIVDGILRMISRKPKDDRYLIRKPENLSRGRESLDEIPQLPLRSVYLRGNDRAIFELLANYFWAVRDTIWKSSPPSSYLRKTVGVQALFDILGKLVIEFEINRKTFSREALTKLLRRCERIDPKGDKYQASGLGRSQIRADLLEALRL